MAGQLKCNSVRATCVPKATKKKLPAVILEMFGPEGTGSLKSIRSVGVSSDGSRWSFDLSGEAQPFEDTEEYLSKKNGIDLRPIC
jgi:hypothetical protein